MMRTASTLLLAALAGTFASSVVFVLVSAASGNTFGWLGAIGLISVLGVWPALVLTFGVGGPALILLRRVKAPLIAYPLTGLAITASLAFACLYLLRSPAGATFLGLMFMNVPYFSLPCALAGGTVITGVISVAEWRRTPRMAQRSALHP